MEIKVGDRITMESWKHDNIFIKVLFVGDQFLFARSNVYGEGSYVLRNDWLPYEEPKKMVKIKLNIVKFLKACQERGALVDMPDSIEVEGELVE